MVYSTVRRGLPDSTLILLDIVKRTNLNYEKANVLFTIGAVYSQLGSTETRISTEGIRKACSYYQVWYCVRDIDSLLTHHLSLLHLHMIICAISMQQAVSSISPENLFQTYDRRLLVISPSPR
jgi:hypothetical protein